MAINMIGTQEVVKLDKSASVSEAITLMRNKHVGTIIALENETPVGILTDRDIVIRVLFNDVDPESLTVGDAMSDDLITVPSHADPLEVLSIMRIKGVRRVPVINGKNNLIGIISVDDIISYFAEEFNELALLLKHERRREAALYLSTKE